VPSIAKTTLQHVCRGSERWKKGTLKRRAVAITTRERKQKKAIMLDKPVRKWEYRIIGNWFALVSPEWLDESFIIDVFPSWAVLADLKRLA